MFETNGCEYTGLHSSDTPRTERNTTEMEALYPAWLNMPHTTELAEAQGIAQRLEGWNRQIQTLNWYPD